MKRGLAAIVALGFASGCGGEIASGMPDSGSAPDGGAGTCTDTASDPDNCGACGRTCVIPGATAGCEDGECAIFACAPGRDDGDGAIGNGCELACDAATVEIHRAVGPTSHLYTANLAAASAAPFHVETARYFRLQSAGGDGRQSVQRCLLGNGKTFITASATCEGAGTVVETLGQWSTAASCGATALYRLSGGPRGDHFYTTSSTERDAAVANGYTFERTVGYVWPE